MTSLELIYQAKKIELNDRKNIANKIGNRFYESDVSYRYF